MPVHWFKWVSSFSFKQGFSLWGFGGIPWARFSFFVLPILARRGKTDHGGGNGSRAPDQIISANIYPLTLGTVRLDPTHVKTVVKGPEGRPRYERSAFKYVTIWLRLSSADFICTTNPPPPMNHAGCTMSKAPAGYQLVGM